MGEKIKMEALSFYDLKAKKKFMSNNYKVVAKKVNGKARRFAVAINPKTKVQCWRALPSKK